MEIPAKTYNEKFESFLKILESDDRFDNVCKNFLESICSALYVNAATVTVSGYENSEPLSYELIADTHKYTVFSFDKGEGLSEHRAPFDALVQVLEGVVNITVNGTLFTVKAGESIVFPANAPHALTAVERFKMLLTMIKE